ncbi:MAG TPA: porin family protein [Flavisolibacter sp.]|jgi:hypothetical protein|nr:porin family protein [Flavisolibacter sp.]
MMKKISLALATLLSCSVLIAQEKPVFGLKAGLNVSDISVENVDDAFDSRLGFHVGGLAHIHLSHKVAFQPELQFSSQGGEYNRSNNELALGYVNIPLMFQYMFNNGFRMEAGPQVGFMVSAEDHIGNLDVDRDADFKGTDFSIGVGLNYLTDSGFGIGGRYNFGVNNIYETGVNDYRNRVFQFSIFYMFDSKHKAKSK